MQRHRTAVLVSASALLLAGIGAASPKREAVTLAASDLKWGPAPPGLPAGGQAVVLYGDPGKKGAFVVRLKAPEGYRIAPHWHSQDEQLTVLSGQLQLSMGDAFDEANAIKLGAADFHFLPARMHHAAMSKGETVVQISGMGPFDIHYLNPADDPRREASAGK